MSYKFFIGLLLLLVLNLCPLGCQFTAPKQKDTHFASLSSLPPEIKFPEELKEKIRYDADNGRLAYKGAMTEEEKARLVALSKNTEYVSAVKTLYDKSQEKRERLSGKESISGEVPPQIREQKDTASKPKTEQLHLEQPVQQKRPSLEGAVPEKQKFTAREVSSDKKPSVAEREVSVLLEEVAADIVNNLAQGFPKNKEKDFTILVEPFLTLDGKQTLLSNLLVEELFTQLSNNRWVGTSLKICCNPSATAFTPVDGRVSGTLIRIGKEVKINARLVSADTHIILSASFVKTPATDVILQLFGAEMPLQKSVEGEDINTRLDSLAWQAEQILHGFQRDKIGQRICLLGFSAIDNKRTFLDGFLAQECETRLVKNKSWILVPRQKISELLGKEVSSLSHISTNELEMINRQLGIDAIVDGTITDLGTAVKVNVRINDTLEGITLGTASIELQKDKKIEYLLAKETQRSSPDSTYVDAKEAKTISLEERQMVKEERLEVAGKVGEKCFLNENFTDPEEIVNRLAQWGKKLAIINEGEKRFLASQGEEFVTISQELKFTENFSFEFTVKGSSKYWNSLKFSDVLGNEFNMDFQLNEGNCFIVLPGPKSIRVKTDTATSNKFKLIRKDNFYEIYVNDALALAGPYSKYGLFKNFTITARLDQVHFTDFVGKAVKG
ncbi:MAG: hypothetical protein QMD05_02335 [Candidatus Brocadiaceae bacterium]|nr:hypothetical protein [Candidatus Brocadiaceae bacterium]